MKLLFLDIGHINKDSKPDDKGASYGGVFEADIAYQYMYRLYDKIVKNLSDTKVKVFFPDPSSSVLIGDYYKRRNWVNRQIIRLADKTEDALYLQAHCNAGGGNYGLIITVFDRMVSESMERAFGKELSKSLEKKTGIKYKDWDGDYDKVLSLDNDDRGYSILKSFMCPAFILEPLFIDNEVHLNEAMNGDLLDKIADACFEVCIKFVNEEIKWNLD